MPTRVSAAAGVDYQLLTASDFLDWLVPGRYADLVDGEIFMHSPVSIQHARLLNFIDAVMRVYIDRHELGTLFREVVAVKLSSRNVFLPDLAFYSSQQSSRIQPTHVVGAPDVVVEVLRPMTAERDIGPKFAEYEQHGVCEYWILDPETHTHRFYRHNGEVLVEYADEEDRIDSAVIPGFFVLREWLDPDRLPRIDDALSRIERQTGK